MIQIVRYPDEVQDVMKETEHVKICPMCGRKTFNFGHTHDGYDIERLSLFETMYIKWVFLECDKCGCAWKYNKHSFTKDIRRPFIKIWNVIKDLIGRN